MIVRRVDPASFARVAGLIYVAIGLLTCAFFSLISLVAGHGLALARAQPTLAGSLPTAFSALFGLGSIVVFPILYGIIGYVTACLGAWFYNPIASRFGGVGIDVA